MALEQYKNVFFEAGTPTIVCDVVLDCIKRGVKVHILTGDPITGLVTPSLKTIGVLMLSEGDQPTVLFKVLTAYDDEGGIKTEHKGTNMWLRTNRILKINEVDTCKLLYQSYECRSSPLKVIREEKYSPYGDKVAKTKIVCSSPETEILVPSDVDAELLCRFLFGQIHYLPECLQQLSADEL